VTLLGFNYMSASAPQSSSSRARTQARKKINDDAAYLGPSASTASAGTKRLAGDKADGEPRTKRKRVDTGHSANSFKKDFEAESRRSLVSFFFPLSFFEGGLIDGVFCRSSSTRCRYMSFSATSYNLISFR